MEGGNPIKDSKTWQEQESKFDKKIIPEIYKSLNCSFNVTRNDIKKIIRTKHKSLRERWKKNYTRTHNDIKRTHKNNRSLEVMSHFILPLCLLEIILFLYQ